MYSSNSTQAESLQRKDVKAVGQPAQVPHREAILVTHHIKEWPKTGDIERKEQIMKLQRSLPQGFSSDSLKGGRHTAFMLGKATRGWAGPGCPPSLLRLPYQRVSGCYFWRNSSPAFFSLSLPEVPVTHAQLGSEQATSQKVSSSLTLCLPHAPPSLSWLGILSSHITTRKRVSTV